jgi:pilus assembly protein CpaE
MAGQEKVRVLIVDDIAETRDNIRRMLQFDNLIEVIGAAQSGREAISLTGQTKPDVVLMDINMPDMDGITATETIRRNFPATQVVILSVQSDPSYMRRAMLAGARDFLTKPPMIDELISAIRQAGKMGQDERAKAALNFANPAVPGSPAGTGYNNNQGKVVVVYSPKGGTGCTMLATNLAVALKCDEPKVILVDASMQFGDVPVFLNEQVKNTVLDLAPRVDEMEPEIVESALITHASTGIQVMASPTKPEMSNQLKAEQFGKLLDYLRGMFPYIVVDTSSYLTEAVQAALDAADVIILVTTQDIPSIKNANLFLGLADVSGIKRNRILFVMNRFDKRIGISPERVGESLRQPIVLTIPFEEKVVAQSVNRGVPFVYENKVQPVSKAIFTLVDLLKAHLAQEQATPDAPAKR